MPPCDKEAQSRRGGIHFAEKSRRSHDRTRKRRGRWTHQEHAQFLRGIEAAGKNWEVVAVYVPTRTALQARTHGQKYFRKVRKGLPFPEQPYEDNYDGKSDAEGSVNGGVAAARSQATTPHVGAGIESAPTAAAELQGAAVGQQQQPYGAGIQGSGLGQQQIPAAAWPQGAAIGQQRQPYGAAQQQQYGAGNPAAAAWPQGAGLGQQQQAYGPGNPTAATWFQGVGPAQQQQQQQQQYGAGNPAAAAWCEDGMLLQQGADMTAPRVASPVASWFDGGGPGQQQQYAGNSPVGAWVRGGGPGYGVTGRLGQRQDQFCELSMSGIFSPPEGAAI